MEQSRLEALGWLSPSPFIPSGILVHRSGPPIFRWVFPTSLSNLPWKNPHRHTRRCASSTPQSLLIQAVCRIFLVITVTDPGISQAHYQLTERPPSSLLYGWGSCLSSLWARRHKQKDPWGFQKHAFYNGDIALSSISLFCCMGHRDIPKATGQRLEKLCS